MSERATRFERVLAYPDGQSTVARCAMTATRLGFDGLVVINALDRPAEPTLESISETYGIELATGVELHPNEPDDASGRLPHLREQVDILAVAGGNTQLNRFVATQRHVDVLTQPIRPGSSFIEAGTIKHAIEYDVAIELDLSPLRQRGGKRVRYLQQLTHLWRVIDHYGASYVVTMRPACHLDFRDVRSMCALGDAIGIEADATEHGIGTWGRLINSHWR